MAPLKKLARDLGLVDTISAKTMATLVRWQGNDTATRTAVVPEWNHSDLAVPKGTCEYDARVDAPALV